ncbi:hypothetical protein DFH07DRAFT_784495 [Mycena maculata]|uniref:Uncharacterized protein n=1 Tax=Mycena maculata TaxID=230809 RepID=A0AAD7HG86_9AGAR|nr:hypothetical protein DFH07DRAFT_784495 [Mycena maculata]
MGIRCSRTSNHRRLTDSAGRLTARVDFLRNGAAANELIVVVARAVSDGIHGIEGRPLLEVSLATGIIWIRFNSTYQGGAPAYHLPVKGVDTVRVGQCVFSRNKSNFVTISWVQVCVVAWNGLDRIAGDVSTTPDPESDSSAKAKELRQSRSSLALVIPAID